MTVVNPLPSSEIKLTNQQISRFVTDSLSYDKSIFVILGTTVTGKTDLALDLAPLLGCDILSADSRLVYKHTNIGTAKPSVDELSLVKHHLINVVEPNIQFTLADYLKFARPIYEKALSENKFLLIVGGTGLYIDALTMGYSLPSGEVPKSIIEKLQNISLGDLLLELDSLDPEEGRRVDRKNKRRVERSLAYILSNQASMGKEGSMSNLNPKVSYIGLQCELDELYSRIENRASKMISEGLIEEVGRLVDQYGENAPGLNSIGYKELMPYLRGEVDIEEVKQQIITHTRQYAKRQRTWFRRNKSIKWFNYP